MDRQEFWEWLESCPTHKWEPIFDEYGFVAVSFPVKEKTKAVKYKYREEK
tara:strand:+ start:2409 stop:2558 length:150 start_codon:yes stop_codon:yes gene_type:complete